MLKSVRTMLAVAAFSFMKSCRWMSKQSFLDGFVRKVVCDTIKGFVDPKDAKRYAGSSDPSMD